ncbi:hypothetical protein CANARDRAFT_181869, partial [[Candida] arabinofermentans NRRL YB-2248]
YDPEDVQSTDSDYEPETLKREEDENDYCEGGYHPTYVGEWYGSEKQYLISRKLGWGHFSTVWLAYDTKNARHVAIKIVRASKNYQEAAIDEIKILEKINSGTDDHPGKKHIVKLLDHFVHVGPNGDHICMVFEVLGENMLSLLLRYKQFQKKKTNEIKERSNSETTSSITTSTPATRTSIDDDIPPPAAAEQHLSTLADLNILNESYGGLPLSLVKQIAKQLLLALDYMHRDCGLIHTDLKPENILVEINDVEKLVHMLEKERKTKKIAQLMASPNSSGKSGETLTPKKMERSRSVTHKHATPIRCSKPLTSPVETSGSVDNFFRSFSFSQRRTSSIVNQPHNQSQSNSKVIPAPMALPSPLLQPTNDTVGEDTIPEEDGETSDDGEDAFVDATEDVNHLMLPFPEPKEGGGFDINPSPQSSVPTTISAGRRVSSLNLNSQLPSIITTPSSMSNTGGITTRYEFDSIISVKIADLGNACWYNQHYTNDIQTRQYRAPEIILGGKWGCSTDMWSLACLIFELITGDYLFDPKNGSSYCKNDDHLAQIVELLQIWPGKEYLKKCKYSREFFDKSFQSFKNINKLKIWTLMEVLVEKYHIDDDSGEGGGLAREIAKFLLAMLEFDPKRRIDAGSMSNSDFLKGVLEDESIDREYGLRGQDIPGYTCEYKD